MYTVQRYPIIIQQLLRDDVLDNFNMVYRDEYSILDQTYQSKYVRIFIMTIFNIHNIIQKYILTSE